ncbi:signal peptidase I [Rubrivivax gelatinosus]|uniref:signal peptidase I n=1 Tax=Rubrivivax gelatinosus TaxID=28068 RepID=UPI0005C195BA|nr:signal peptidase I [Rubrivivax gelatinosus]MBG6083002.1 conjugal transfer pilin signal peptidase TrbI [Rubrivivax gelatinosus]
MSAIVDRLRSITSDAERMRFLRLSVLCVVMGWSVLSIMTSTVGRTYRIGLDLANERCLPWRVYLMHFERPAVQHGAYVVYIDRAGVMGPKWVGKIVGKQIVGVPGDRVVIRNDFAWVNGRPVGALIHNAKLGKGPRAFDRDEVVPPGKLFVAGAEPASYDSRYWGFLDQRDLVGSIRPLF